MQTESKQPHSKRSALQRGRQILERREVGGISPAEKILEHHNKTKK